MDYIFVTPRLLDHVKRCGFEAYHQRFISDHRGGFVDLDIAGLFDRRLPPLIAAPSRAIRSTHPTNVTKYIQRLHKWFVDWNVVVRMDVLKQNFCPKKFDRLDKCITEGIIATEDRLRIIHRLPWSPEVHVVMTTMYILKANLSQIRTHQDLSLQIDRHQKTLKFPVQLHETTETASKALNKTRKEFRRLKKEMRTMQTTRQEEISDAFVAMNPTIPEKLAKQIFQRAQETKKMMQELPKKNRSSGLNLLHVPIPNTGDDQKFATIDDGDKIKEILLAHNKRHFNRAADTPMASSHF